MLDVGWSELLVIAIVMIVVVGPKDLPRMLRAFGKATARMRTTANEFRNQFNEALKEAELDDVKTIIDETRKLDPRSKLTQVFDPIRSAGEDLKSSLQTSSSPITPAVTGDSAGEVASQETLAPAQPAQAEAAPAKPAAAVKKPRKAAAKPETAKATSAKTPTAKTSVAKPAAPAKKAAPKKTSTKVGKTTGTEA